MISSLRIWHSCNFQVMHHATHGHLWPHFSLTLWLVNFLMGTDTIHVLDDIQPILCLMFHKQNLHFPSKEIRVGNLQFVHHLGHLWNNRRAKFTVELEVVSLIVFAYFKFYFPIDFIGVSRGSVGGQLTRGHCFLKTLKISTKSVWMN